MKTGTLVDLDRPFDVVAQEMIDVSEHGISSAWVSQIFAMDALTVLAAVAREVPQIELGTAVVPVHPRHPFMLAAQALTVQAISCGRLTLGVGLSHKPVIETVFGGSFDRPVQYMKEYLSILQPLLHEKEVAFVGERLKSTTFGPIEVEASAPSVLLAAMGTAMLGLAGRATDGTVTWMTGPATVRDHIIPTISASAMEASRPSPRIVVGLPICVTHDVDQARDTAARSFRAYNRLPSYRAMLDREGAAGPANVAIIGTAGAVRAQLLELAEFGATDFFGSPFGTLDERKAAFDVLASAGS